MATEVPLLPRKATLDTAVMCETALIGFLGRRERDKSSERFSVAAATKEFLALRHRVKMSGPPFSSFS